MTLTAAQHETRRPIDWMSRSQLSDSVAFVAGGGSGIGEATARVLAATGASVVVADRRGEMAERVAHGIGNEGGKALAVAMDVTVQAEIDAALQRTIERFGVLDILVNCAGVIKPASLDTLALDDWRNCFLVNVDGALMLARSSLPHLRRSHKAAIVNVSSLAGGRAYPNGGAYGPSKAALISLTRQMALEWAPHGVRVNVVNPGTIDTPLSREHMTPQSIAARQASIPLGRLAHPGEVADLIVFLASPAASFITAQDFNCDGGLSQNLMAQKFHANT